MNAVNKINCSICLEEENEEKMTKTNCPDKPHEFHHSCIERWIQQKHKEKAEGTCPLCRHVIAPLPFTQKLSTTCLILLTAGVGALCGVLGGFVSATTTLAVKTSLLAIQQFPGAFSAIVGSAVKASALIGTGVLLTALAGSALLQSRLSQRRFQRIVDDNINFILLLAVTAGLVRGYFSVCQNISP